MVGYSMVLGRGRKEDYSRVREHDLFLSFFLSFFLISFSEALPWRHIIGAFRDGF